MLVGLLASVVVFLGIYFAMRGRMPLHRLVFVLVLCFGMLYSFVLPPYAAPDEKYHINQSFTLACKWANMLSPDEWRMGNVPLDMTYRREHDFDPLLQNEKTTVFSWQELSENLFTTTPDSFDSHTALEELQTDRNPTLYLFSAAAVFLAYVFHLGFVPALMLGRTANLIVFALLAALAVKAAPFGRRVFAAAALLPMTLHLAASFSRDSLLLGLAFAFSALCMQAIFGCKDGLVLPVRLWLPLAVFGILLAPAKLVYLPLAALFLLIPNSRFGQSAATKKPLIWPDACCWRSASTALCWSPRWPVLPGLKIRLLRRKPLSPHRVLPRLPRFLIQQQRQLTIVLCMPPLPRVTAKPIPTGLPTCLPSTANTASNCAPPVLLRGGRDRDPAEGAGVLGAGLAGAS